MNCPLNTFPMGAVMMVVKSRFTCATTELVLFEFVPEKTYTKPLVESRIGDSTIGSEPPFPATRMLLGWENETEETKYEKIVNPSETNTLLVTESNTGDVSTALAFTVMQKSTRGAVAPNTFAM